MFGSGAGLNRQLAGPAPDDEGGDGQRDHIHRQHFDLTPVGRDDPAAPAERWQVDGGPHTVGIIASVTRQFCAACDRTRVTAEGTVRPCLFGDDETDLLTPLRAGATDAEVGELWKQAMWGKWAGHGGLTDDRPRAKRTMGGIGG